MKRTICELKGLYPTLWYVITGNMNSNYLHKLPYMVFLDIKESGITKQSIVRILYISI